MDYYGLILKILISWRTKRLICINKIGCIFFHLCLALKPIPNIDINFGVIAILLLHNLVKVDCKLKTGNTEREIISDDLRITLCLSCWFVLVQVALYTNVMKRFLGIQSDRRVAKHFI